MNTVIIAILGLVWFYLAYRWYGKRIDRRELVKGARGHGRQSTTGASALSPAGRGSRPQAKLFSLSQTRLGMGRPAKSASVSGSDGLMPSFSRVSMSWRVC